MGSSASVWVLNVAIFLGAIPRRHTLRGSSGKPKLPRGCPHQRPPLSQRGALRQKESAAQWGRCGASETRTGNVGVGEGFPRPLRITPLKALQFRCVVSDPDWHLIVEYQTVTAETAKGKAPLASGASDGSRWRKRRAAPVRSTNADMAS
jgi:hypothetical protein